MGVSRRGLAAAAGIVLANAGFEAAAQPQSLERIVVTGSHVGRADYETPAPIQVLTREQIERSGAMSAAELVRRLPANSTLSFDETFLSGFARGSAGASLRGLGQRNTLVLVNGRRMAVYGFAELLQDNFVDLNSIPLAAIERVEVLKDGASAIYGSDAIAGVINIILRKDYTGAEATLTGGITRRSDGEELRVSGAFGVGDLASDRYNLTVAADYFDRGPIWARDRALTADGDYRGIPGGQFTPNSVLSNPGTYVALPGTLPFPGATLPFPNCPADRVIDFFGSTYCTLNQNQYWTAVPETRRAGIFGRGSFALGGATTAFAELGFNRYETFMQAVPFGAPGVQLGPDFARFVSIVLPAGHNSNPFGVPVEVYYGFTDVGPVQIRGTTEALRAVAGLDGEWRGWRWETAAGHTRSLSRQDDRNNIRVSGLLSVIADGSYDFLDNSRNTPEVIERLRANFSRTGDSRQSFVDARASGDLARLAHGPVAMAVGAEYRREEVRDRSEDLLATGDVLSRGLTQARGSRNVGSAYVELSVPAMEHLEVQLAGRVDRYSDYGTSATPKAGLRWRAAPGLALRGTYGRGFRAPSIAESSESTTLFFRGVQDTTRCAIDEVYCGVLFVPGSLTANPELTPEKSENWTAGLVWEPARGVALGLDYYRIRQKNVISFRDFQFILDNEARYGRFVTRAPPSTADLARGAPGAVILVAVPFENLSRLVTDGFDLDARWTLPGTIVGRFSVALAASYVLSYKAPFAPEEPLSEFAGEYNVPRLRALGTLEWDRAPWSGTLAVSHVDRFRQFSGAAPGADPYIRSWTTWDLQGSWSGLRNATLTLGVKNLTDRAPPIAIAETLLYVFNQHSVRGRFLYASIGYRFR